MNSNDNDAISTGDPISDIIAAVLREGSHDELLRSRLPKNTVQQAAVSIADNPMQGDKILAALFPNGIPANELFYDGLIQLEYRLGHHNDLHQLNGLIWSRAFSQLLTADGFALIEAFAHKNSRSFFVGLAAFPTFLQTTSLPAAFLAHWIPEVRIRLGNDMASGGF